MSSRIIIEVNSKIDRFIAKISKEYLDLIRLELDVFRIILLCEGFPIGDKLIHITISGDDEKINQRRKILYSTFYLQKKDLLDNYFMKISKLFDISNSNKTLSLPNLVNFLEKNIRFFEKDQNAILKIIFTYRASLENINHLLIDLRKHRDKCLAHNEDAIECNHLVNITSKDTAKILLVVFEFIVNLNEILGKKTIDKDQIQQMRDIYMKQNYILLKRFEADIN